MGFTANQDLTVTPVHIAQFQGRDLADPQPEPQQQRSTAKSRRPNAVRRSQEDNSRAACRRSIGCGRHLAGQDAADGTAPANPVSVTPARCR
jgi:hypothetical protein